MSKSLPLRFEYWAAFWIGLSSLLSEDWLAIVQVGLPSQRLEGFSVFPGDKIFAFSQVGLFKLAWKSFSFSMTASLRANISSSLINLRIWLFETWQSLPYVSHLYSLVGLSQSKKTGQISHRTACRHLIPFTLGRNASQRDWLFELRIFHSQRMPTATATKETQDKYNVTADLKFLLGWDCSFLV